jgi:hypothetical protein
MKKRMLTLVFVAGAAVLMIAGYFIYKAVSAPQDKTSEIELFEATGISKISYVYQGEELSFVKQDGAWSYESDGSFPLNTAYLRDMENALLSVTASQTLGGGSLEEFGLADPSCVISAVADDGREFQCELGNDNDTVNIVYVRFGGNIYVLSDDFSRRFRHSLLEMASRDKLLSIKVSEVTAFSMENANGFFALTQYPDGAPGAYSKQLTWAFSDGSYGDTESMKQLVNTIADMRPVKCLSYLPDEKALEAFGLSKPACVAEVKYSGGDTIVQIGQKNEDGQYSVYLPNSKLIYTFEPDVPEALIQYKQADCMNRYVFLMDYSEITSVQIDGEGVSKRIDFTDRDTAWDFYYALSTMRAEDFADEALPTSGDIVLTVNTDDPKTTYTLSFSKYDENFYSVCFMDSMIKLVNKRNVENLLSVVKS